MKKRLWLWTYYLESSVRIFPSLLCPLSLHFNLLAVAASGLIFKLGSQVLLSKPPAAFQNPTDS